MPPDHRFQHHGEPVETREQWAARQAAVVHAQELAAAQRRQATAAVEAKRRELEAATAKRTEAAPSRRVPVSGAWSPATGRRSLVLAGLVVLCLTSGLLAWSGREPSPPAPAADADSSTAISKSKLQPEPSAPKTRVPRTPGQSNARFEAMSAAGHRGQTRRRLRPSRMVGGASVTRPTPAPTIQLADGCPKSAQSCSRWWRHRAPRRSASAPFPHSVVGTSLDPTPGYGLGTAARGRLHLSRVPRRRRTCARSNERSAANPG